MTTNKKGRPKLTEQQNLETEKAFALYLTGKTMPEVIKIMSLKVGEDGLRKRFINKYQDYYSCEKGKRKLKSLSSNNILNVIDKDYASDLLYKDVVEQWLKENAERVALYEASQPLKVLTEKQEQDLTYAERCGEGNNDMIDSIVDAIKEEGWSYNYTSEEYSKAYFYPHRISPPDLHECLSFFFKGKLDDVDEYMDRLYRPARELHPSNSLFGYLTTVDVKQALEQMKSSHEQDYVHILSTHKDNNLDNMYTASHEYIDSLDILASYIKQLIFN